ncbi:serine/arginine repetitive matrix protein 5-like [Electrophorus electricus]|uniref:serine/arginine repetitive matrix protein 5-like n=1 Tax=Electrophorus electricus TaxID=8005 RepID=UPI0015CFAFB0|nr:serine/arginine repetitive matrix protein 5-like [Electrophorus electricus]
MTRLDSPLHHADSCSVMETRSRSSSRRGSRCTDSRKEKEQTNARAIFKRANRFLSLDRETRAGSPLPPVRYYERGHPLPSNCSPERKATIPFRNPDLGLPSHRRRYDTLGLSPQRHMPYSNFRRGDSQSRASPRSGSPRSANVSPHRRIELFRSSSPRRGSASQRPGTSYASPRQASRKCSPSRRRDSRGHSPSQTSGSNRYAGSGPSHKRYPSQSSHGHSLDSEKLYRNLKSIASSAESDDSQQERRYRSNAEADSRCHKHGRSSRSSGCNSRESGCNTGRNSRDFSPPGSDYDNRSRFSQKGSSHVNGYNRYNSCDTSPVHGDYDKNGHSSPKEKKHGHSGTDKATSSSKSSASQRHSRTDLSQSQGSWHGSSHSLPSPASSRNISPSRRSPKEAWSMTQAVTTETGKQSDGRNRSTIRRGLEALILSERTRSASQPVPEMTIEDYVVIADIPRMNLYPEEEDGIVVRRRPQSRSPRRDDQHREDSNAVGDYGEQQERGRGRERGREHRDRRRHDKDTGGSSETNSNASGPAQVS